MKNFRVLASLLAGLAAGASLAFVDTQQEHHNRAWFHNYVIFDKAITPDGGIEGPLTINGNVSIQGDAGISSNLQVAGDAGVAGSMQINGDLTVSGTITGEGIGAELPDNLTISGDAGVAGNFWVAGDAGFGSEVLLQSSASRALTIQRIGSEGDLGLENPEFRIGDIHSAGVGLPEMQIKIGYTGQTPRKIYGLESTGTAATVSDGQLRSGFENFYEDGSPNPTWRINAYPNARLQMGPGSCHSVAGNLARLSNVVTVTCDRAHGIGAGQDLFMNPTEGDLAAFSGTITVATVPSSTTFTFASTGTNFTSAVTHYFGSRVDTHLARTAPNELSVQIGGTADPGGGGLYGSATNHTTFGTTGLTLNTGLNLIVDGNLIKTDASNNRVGINTTSPTVALDVTGAVLASTTVTGTTGLATPANSTTALVVGPSHELEVDTTNNRVGVNKAPAYADLDVSGSIIASTSLGLGLTSTPGQMLHMNGGNFLFDGSAETAMMYKRSGAQGSRTGPRFLTGRITTVGLLTTPATLIPKWRIFYEDANYSEVEIYSITMYGDVAHAGSYAGGYRDVVFADTPFSVGSQRFLTVNATSGSITLNLPATSGHAGLTYTFTRTDASGNTITIDGNASETINGATTNTTALNAQYATTSIFTDGTNWFIY